MISFRKLALVLVAAGSALSAHAQTGQSDAERRAANREAAMERRMKMDREGSSNVPVVAPSGRGYHHRHYGYRGHRVHHRHMRLHRHHTR